MRLPPLFGTARGANLPAVQAGSLAVRFVKSGVSGKPVIRDWSGLPAKRECSGYEEGRQGYLKTSWRIFQVAWGGRNRVRQSVCFFWYETG